MADIAITVDTSEVRRMEKELNNLQRELSDTKVEIAALAAAGEKGSKGFRILKAAQHEAAAESLKYKAAIQSSKAAQQALAVQNSVLQVELNQTAQALVNTANKANTAADQIHSISEAGVPTTTALNSMETALERLNNQFGQSTADLKSTGVALKAFETDQKQAAKAAKVFRGVLADSQVLKTVEHDMRSLREEYASTGREIAYSRRELQGIRAQFGDASAAANHMSIAIQKLEKEYNALGLEIKTVGAQSGLKEAFNTGQVLQFDASLGKTAGSLDDLRDRMQKVQTEYRDMLKVSDVEAAKMAQQEFAAQLRETNKEVKFLRQSMQGLDDEDPAMDELAAQLDKAERQARQLSDSLDIVKDDLKVLGTVERKRAADTKTAAAAEKAARKEARDAVNAYGASVKQLTPIVNKITAQNKLALDATRALKQENKAAKTTTAAYGAALKVQIAAEKNANKGRLKSRTGMQQQAVATQKLIAANRDLAAANKASISINQVVRKHLVAEAAAKTKAAAATIDLENQVKELGLTEHEFTAALRQATDATEAHRIEMLRVNAATDGQIASVRRLNAERLRGTTMLSAGRPVTGGAAANIHALNAAAPAFANGSAIYTRGLGQINQQLGRVATTAAFMRTQIMSIIAIMGLARFGKLVTELDQADKAIQALNLSTQKLNDTTIGYAGTVAYLDTLSAKYGTRNKDLVSSYNLLTASTSEAGISLAKAQETFEGVIAASRVLGKSNQDIVASLTAVAQVASKGVVSMEELRQQLGERLPGAIAILADGLHITTAELIDQIEDGAVSAGQFFEVFGAGLIKRYGDAAKGIMSLSRAFSELGQTFDTLVTGAMSAGLTEGIQGIVSAFSTMLESQLVVQFFEDIGASMAGLGEAMQWIADGMSGMGAQITFWGAEFTVFEAIVTALQLALTLLAVSITTRLIMSLAALVSWLGATAAATWGVVTGVTALKVALGPIGLAIAVLGSAIAFVAAGLGHSVPEAAEKATVAVAATTKAIAQSTASLEEYKRAQAAHTANTTKATQAALAKAKIIMDTDAEVMTHRRNMAKDVLAQQQADLDEQKKVLVDHYAEMRGISEKQRGGLDISAQEELAKRFSLTAGQVAVLKAEIASMQHVVADTESWIVKLTAALKAAGAAASGADLLPKAEDVSALVTAFGAYTSARLAVEKGGGEALEQLQERSEYDDLRAKMLETYGTAWDAAIKKMGLATDEELQLLRYMEDGLDVLTESAKVADEMRATKAELAAIEKTIRLDTYATAEAARLLREEGVAAYEAYIKLGAAATDVGDRTKEILDGMDDTTRALSGAEAEARKLAEAEADAAKAAGETAAAATRIAAALQRAVAFANNLRRALGAQAVNNAEIQKDINNLVAQESEYLKGNVEAAEHMAAGREREALATSVAASESKKMLVITDEIANLRAKGADQSTQDLEALKVLQTQLVQQKALSQDTLTLELQRYDAVVATNKAREGALASEKAASTGGKGGKGGGAAKAKADAKALTAALKHLETVTKDARAETAALSAEAIKLATSQRIVNAALAAGTISMRNYDIEMALVQQRYNELIHGTEDLAKTFEDEFRSMTDSASDSFAEFLVNGADDFATFKDSIIDGFKDLIKQMISTAINNTIKINILTPMFGGVGGLGGAGGIFGTLMGSMSSGAGIFGGIASTLTGGIGAIGTAFQGLSGIMSGGLTAGIGALGTALGAVIPVIGIAAAAISFFKKKTETLNEGFYVWTKGMASFSWEWSKTLTKQFWGLKKSTTTNYVRMVGEAADTINGAVTQVIRSVVDGATLLGTGVRNFINLTAEAWVDLQGLDPEQRAEALEKALHDIGSAYAKNIAGLRDFQRAGEDLYDTIIRLATSFSTVVNTFRQVGLNRQLAQTFGVGPGSGDRSLMSGAQASRLVDKFGGAEAFVAGMANYAKTFFSANKLIKLETRSLTAQFNSVAKGIVDFNKEMPTTRQGFQDLVEGLNLSHRGRQEMFAFLIKNADAFDRILPAAEEAADAIDTVAERLDAFALAAEAAQGALDRNVPNTAGERRSLYNDRLAGDTGVAAAERDQALKDQRKLNRARLDDLKEAGKKYTRQVRKNEQDMFDIRKLYRKTLLELERDATLDLVSEQVTRKNLMLGAVESEMALRTSSKALVERGYALRADILAKHTAVAIQEAERLGGNVNAVNRKYHADLLLMEQQKTKDLLAINKARLDTRIKRTATAVAVAPANANRLKDQFKAQRAAIDLNYETQLVGIRKHGVRWKNLTRASLNEQLKLRQDFEQKLVQLEIDRIGQYVAISQVRIDMNENDIKAQRTFYDRSAKLAEANADKALVGIREGSMAEFRIKRKLALDLEKLALEEADTIREIHITAASNRKDNLGELVDFKPQHKGLLERFYDAQKNLTKKEFADRIAEARAAGVDVSLLQRLRNATLLDLQKQYNEDYADLVERGLEKTLERVENLTSRRSDIVGELVSRYAALRSAADTLRETRQGFNRSGLAPGDELSQLAAIQRAFTNATALAQTGDVDAASRAATLAQELLQQGQMVYGSSTDYGELFRTVNATLLATQRALGSEATQIKKELGPDEFEEITQKTTNQLLNALGRIDDRLKTLNEEIAETRSQTSATDQRDSTGTDGGPN